MDHLNEPPLRPGDLMWPLLGGALGAGAQRFAVLLHDPLHAAFVGGGSTHSFMPAMKLAVVLALASALVVAIARTLKTGREEARRGLMIGAAPGVACAVAWILFALMFAKGVA